jgi:hypothetical protein
MKDKLLRQLELIGGIWEVYQKRIMKIENEIKNLDFESVEGTYNKFEESFSETISSILCEDQLNNILGVELEIERLEEIVESIKYEIVE